MTDPYNTFDTFTVGSDAEPMSPEPAKVPSIIARLPNVAPATTRTRKRFDEPESPLPQAHLYEAVDTASDLDSTGLGLPTRSLPGDPTATIRIDTVMPGAFDERPAAQATTTQSEPAYPQTIPFRPAEDAKLTPSVSATADEPWTAWMLDLESTIQPYARWIALAAVLAALCLVLVLLRGGGGSAENIDTAPQVFNETDLGHGLAGDYETDSAAPYWPTQVAEETTKESGPSLAPNYVAATEGVLRPLDGSIASATPPPVAAGPASASRSAGAARLTGQLLPPEASRIDVADAKYDTANPGTLR